MGITLKRNAAWFRPYYVEINSKEYQVDKIHIYKDGKILVSTCQGWFENKNRGDVESVELLTEKIIKRIKEKFDGEVFGITHKESYTNETHVNIYIPAEMLDINFAEYRIEYDQLWAVYQGNQGIVIRQSIKSLTTHRNKIVDEYMEIHKQIGIIYSIKKDEGEKILSLLDEMKKLVKNYVKENNRIKNLTVEEALRQD